MSLSTVNALDRLLAGERPETLTAEEVDAAPARFFPPARHRPVEVIWDGPDPVRYLWWTDRYYREDVFPPEGRFP